MDGDADRLVYFTKVNGNFALLDGDRIAVLAALYINKCLGGLSDECNLKVILGEPVKKRSCSAKHVFGRAATHCLCFLCC